MSIIPPLPGPQKRAVTAFDWLRFGWPFVLILLGGMLGGALGGRVVAINQWVFQTAQRPILKYAWMGLVSIAVTAVFLIIGAIFHFYFNKQS